MYIENINLLLSVLTLFTDIIIVFFLIYILYISNFNKKIIITRLKEVLFESGPWLILSISLIATLGSLFYSEIIGYTPCTLCWYQRIFMYPLVISSIVLIKIKSKDILYFILPMSILGIIFATYHYFIRFLTPLLSCSIDGINCTIREFMSFGYITIPMMALTAFISIFIISFLMTYLKK